MDFDAVSQKITGMNEQLQESFGYFAQLRLKFYASKLKPDHQNSTSFEDC